MNDTTGIHGMWDQGICTIVEALTASLSDDAPLSATSPLRWFAQRELAGRQPMSHSSTCYDGMTSFSIMLTIRESQTQPHSFAGQSDIGVLKDMASSSLLGS